MMGGKKPTWKYRMMFHKVKNNRRDAISNTRGIDAKQPHPSDNREETSSAIYFFWIRMYL